MKNEAEVVRHSASLLRLLTFLGCFVGLLVGLVCVEWSVRYRAGIYIYELTARSSPIWARPQPTFSILAAANAARGSNAVPPVHGNAPFTVETQYATPPSPGGTFIVEGLVAPTVLKAAGTAWVFFCLVALIGRVRKLNVDDPVVSVASASAVGGTWGLLAFLVLLWATAFWIGVPYLLVLGMIVGALVGVARVMGRGKRLGP